MIQEKDKKPDQNIVDQLRQCSVKINLPHGFGTGFFIAPGKILTCAHVIKGPGNKPLKEDAIQIQWQSKVSTPRINAFILNEGSDQGLDNNPNNPYPDLSLLSIEYKDNPSIRLNAEIDIQDKCYVYGFSKNCPDGDSLTIEYEGPAFGGRLLKFKEGNAISGFSGSPILNLRTSGICGMLKRTRDENSALGGYGIRVERILDFFKDYSQSDETPYGDALTENIHNGRKSDALFLQTLSLTDLESQLSSSSDIISAVKLLPQVYYEDEYAFAVLYYLEKAFSAFEISTLNKPPLIFWDEEDLDSWLKKLPNKNLHQQFRGLFKSYQDYFEKLIFQSKKHCIMILNLPTFRDFLKEKTNSRRKQLLLKMCTYIVEYPKYEVIFFEDKKQQKTTITEYELISANDPPPDTLQGNTISAVLRTAKKGVGYNKLFLQDNEVAVEDDYDSAYHYWVNAVQNYEKNKKRKLKDRQIREITLDILSRLQMEFVRR